MECWKAGENMSDLICKELCADEIPSALSLAWEVFQVFDAPDYSEKGIEEFHRCLKDSAFCSSCRFFGAYSQGNLVGMIATCQNNTHIALFFVKQQFQCRGIGCCLLNEVLQRNTTGSMTVNSSPMAVPIYHKYGFFDTAPEQLQNGIRYTPMRLDIVNKKKG